MELKWILNIEDQLVSNLLYYSQRLWEVSQPEVGKPKTDWENLHIKFLNIPTVIEECWMRRFFIFVIDVDTNLCYFLVINSWNSSLPLELAQAHYLPLLQSFRALIGSYWCIHKNPKFSGYLRSGIKKSSWLQTV